jgi:hypothetical protein
MPRGIEGNEIASTKKPTPKLSSQPSASKGQKTLLGFFQKTQGTPQVKKDSSIGFSSPVPSSDPIARSSPPHSATPNTSNGKNKENGLLTPATHTSTPSADRLISEVEGLPSSPIRKVLDSFLIKRETC